MLDVCKLLNASGPTYIRGHTGDRWDDTAVKRKHTAFISVHTDHSFEHAGQLFAGFSLA